MNRRAGAAGGAVQGETVDASAADTRTYPSPTFARVTARLDDGSTVSADLTPPDPDVRLTAGRVTELERIIATGGPDAEVAQGLLDGIRDELRARGGDGGK